MIVMTWCNDTNDVVQTPMDKPNSGNTPTPTPTPTTAPLPTKSCPSCGHLIKQARINDLPGLPAGVRFDPTDQELIQHLEGKVRMRPHHQDDDDSPTGLHPLIDDFIPTLEGQNGICYTHPEKLPGVSKDGQVRHFFHRPSKAYTTGTRKRRKVHTDEDGSETRWHKTGKTRPVLINGRVKGYKKILVLYTNYGKQKKPEKTNWVMHQYHLGIDEEERDGELVVSKVFYQTQPRQCGSILKINGRATTRPSPRSESGEYYNNHSSIISFEQRSNAKGSSASTPMFPFCCP